MSDERAVQTRAGGRARQSCNANAQLPNHQSNATKQHGTHQRAPVIAQSVHVETGGGQPWTARLCQSERVRYIGHALPHINEGHAKIVISLHMHMQDQPTSRGKLRHSNSPNSHARHGGQKFEASSNQHASTWPGEAPPQPVAGTYAENGNSSNAKHIAAKTTQHEAAVHRQFMQQSDFEEQQHAADPALDSAVLPQGEAYDASTCSLRHLSSEPWQKVLWKAQTQPDNYTDASFLEDLVVNAHVPVRNYCQVVLGSVAIAQQLCTVVMSVAVPAHLAYGSLSAQVLLCICAVLLAAGYLTCAVLGHHLLGGSLARGLRQCGLLVGGVFCLSPVLHSLTRTVSGDSVIALTVLLLLAHLFLHDYSFVNSVTDKLAGAVSFSSAVISAVLIASLMPSEAEVVLFSLEAYLLSPYARRYIRQASTTAHIVFTVLMSAASAALLWPLSQLLTAAFVVSLVMVTVICPWWLVSIHKFKAKINGPWDEAVPHIPRELASEADLINGHH